MEPPRKAFDIAIICALPREFDAVEALLDETYSDVTTLRYHGDSNFYQTGRIRDCDIVLACLADMGKARAAGAAASLRSSFPDVILTFLVGVCGGVPFPTEDTELLLGDVIISRQILSFDFGKQYPDRFQRTKSIKETLDRSNTDAIALLSGLQTRRTRDRFQKEQNFFLQGLQHSAIWQYPGIDKDRLFMPSYPHRLSREPGQPDNCDSVNCSGQTVARKRLNTSSGYAPRPFVHRGTIASGDTVMKSGDHRDTLAREERIIGFEMEGAGVCENLSCIIANGLIHGDGAPPIWVRSIYF